jgi:hypothetical protein
MRFNPYAPATVNGAPYSAEDFEDVDQTLSDGTHIRRHMFLNRKYRDSMGRVREETPAYMHAGADGPMIVRIYDPVAHLQYVLDPEQKIAHRGELQDRRPLARFSTTHSAPSQQVAGLVAASAISPGHDWWKPTNEAGSQGPPPAPAATATAPSLPCAAPARHTTSNSPRPISNSDDLGSDTIEGIPVQGRRTTTTYPAGSQGNDRPFSVTHEHWRSSELNLDVLWKTDDPRSGVRAHQLVNISPSEPDASLFQPPPGYAVKDETGEFTITLSIPQS